MIPLRKTSGLAIRYDENKNKLLSSEITIPKPSIRKLKELKPVVYDKDTKKPKELYFMYRDVKPDKDKKLFKKHNLRYDITVIPPAKLGKEYVKTLGHYHKRYPGSKLEYPEVYEILHGTAQFLFQKKQGKKVVEVIAVKAKKGDRIAIPQNYGHITINPSNKVLIMANMVSTRFKPDYEDILKHRGGAYYYLTNRKFVKNKNYSSLPRLKQKNAKSYLLTEKKTLYQSFINTPSHFKFLNKPVKYKVKA